MSAPKKAFISMITVLTLISGSTLVRADGDGQYIGTAVGAIAGATVGGIAAPFVPSDTGGVLTFIFATLFGATIGALIGRHEDNESARSSYYDRATHSWVDCYNNDDVRESKWGDWDDRGRSADRLSVRGRTVLEREGRFYRDDDRVCRTYRNETWIAGSYYARETTFWTKCKEHWYSKWELVSEEKLFDQSRRGACLNGHGCSRTYSDCFPGANLRHYPNGYYCDDGPNTPVWAAPHKENPYCAYNQDTKTEIAGKSWEDAQFTCLTHLRPGVTREMAGCKPCSNYAPNQLPMPPQQAAQPQPRVIYNFSTK